MPEIIPPPMWTFFFHQKLRSPPHFFSCWISSGMCYNVNYLISVRSTIYGHLNRHLIPTVCLPYPAQWCLEFTKGWAQSAKKKTLGETEQK